MTYNRPGAGTHVVNDTAGVILHNAPVVLQGHVGVVVKQKATKWSDGLVAANQIQIGEKAWLVKKGIVMVNDPGGLGNDGPVYITPAQVLTATAAGNTKFGRVVEVIGDGRGVPTGKVRIDLDEKDSF